MIRLAFGARCGAGRMPLNGLGGGAVGAAAEAGVPRLSRPRRATPPRPRAERARKSRRFRAKSRLLQWRGMLVFGGRGIGPQRHRGTEAASPGTRAPRDPLDAVAEGRDVEVEQQAERVA